MAMYGTERSLTDISVDLKKLENRCPNSLRCLNILVTSLITEARRGIGYAFFHAKNHD